jgi:ubiquinone/menaquinone biosynthesis C-methylase UbiE
MLLVNIFHRSRDRDYAMSGFGGYRDEPFCAGFYDHIPGNAERTDVEFYVSRAQSVKGNILELGCGTGRVLIPTAEAGCRITGPDISEHMLARCREKLKEKPQHVQKRVRLVQGTMTGFDLEETGDDFRRREGNGSG